ncbi:MAG: ATP-binding cassette domain-containing protein [Candidatus Syntrophopropionicum ammoniitolerans]
MLLRVEKISKEYTSGIFRSRRHRVLEEVTFALAQGETLGLVGESGCGKSTLARIILGLTPPSSGKVFLLGQEVFSRGGRLKKNSLAECRLFFNTLKVPLTRG